MSIKLTKKEKLLSARLPVAVDYWLIHGRIYTPDGSGYWRFKFVVSVDLELDTFDNETGEIIPYDFALENVIDGFLCGAWNVSKDAAARARFFEDCNETIRRWNNSRAA